MPTREVGTDDNHQQIPIDAGRYRKFHIHSEEVSVCPVCGGTLTVAGSRKRGVINTSGEKQTLIIRRLRCKSCGTIHHELPDIVIPYKRHSAETVDRIVAGSLDCLFCEDSTIRRIKAWWSACRLYFVHGEFYDSLDQTVVEDCFRKAVLKEGLPRRVYFDNGKQYRTKWMERACAILGIKLLFAKPYSPESTGKIERFNRTVDSFLDEVALENCKTLSDYNKYFGIWLAECYHKRKHGGLNGKTPEIAYKTSKSPLRFVPPETVASAFMRVERRKVDKSGCIQFGGKRYEVGVLLVGRTVDVAYDPNDIGTLTVEYDNKSWRVQELQIGEHTGPRPKLPKSILPALPNTSRLLDEKEKQYTARQDAVRRAIRYDGLEGGEGDV